MRCFSLSAVTTFPGQESIVRDTQHAQSWAKIQEIENRAPPEKIVEETEITPPNFTVHFQTPETTDEGKPIHLEGHVEPTNDPNLQVCCFLMP